MNYLVTTILLVLGVCATTNAFNRTFTGYGLADNWVGGDIFNNMDFYSGADPTHGYVYYATHDQAIQWGFATVKGNQAIIRSDGWSVTSGAGRGSVRLQSKKIYQRGLFLFDFEHMPIGCGTWPAVWTSNLNTWPAGGEIDILEGVNNNNGGNTITLHTSPGCTFPTGQHDETGTTITGDCGAGGGNQGCSVKDYDGNSYGTQFNNIRGGVYAMQWEASGVYVWFFPRNSIPGDILNNNPNPAGWGLPRANFNFAGGCNSGYFHDHHIIIDNTFCGDWAGAVFGSMCGGDCVNFVKNNPGAFTEAYWVFNSIRVFQ